MKKIILVSAGMMMSVVGFTQIQDPVKWIFSAKKINASIYEIHLTAALQGGWHTYSQTTPAGGPVPTTISFTKNPLITLQGTAKEIGKLEQHNKPLFGVDVKQFSDKVDFVQVVKVVKNVTTAIGGTVEFMVCNDHECLPPKTESFNIQVK